MTEFTFFYSFVHLCRHRHQFCGLGPIGGLLIFYDFWIKMFTKKKAITA